MVDRPENINGIWLSAVEARAQAAAQLPALKILLDQLVTSCRAAGMPIEEEAEELRGTLDSIGTDLVRLGGVQMGNKAIRRPDRQLSLEFS